MLGLLRELAGYTGSPSGVALLFLWISTGFRTVCAVTGSLQGKNRAPHARVTGRWCDVGRAGTSLGLTCLLHIPPSRARIRFCLLQEPL